MPKFFYRIEHKKSKIGPYRHDLKNGKSFYFVMEEQLNYDQFNGSYHRTPHQDKLGDYVPNRLENDARFGFVSLSQLKKWWGTDPKVYNLFKKYGFVLCRYKVETRFHSRRQAVAMIQELKNGVEIPFDKLIPKEYNQP